MPYLQSAILESVVYNEDEHVLKARFRDSGDVVLYEGVPQEIYDSLIFAESVGGFFRRHIEGRYPAHKL